MITFLFTLYQKNRFKLKPEQFESKVKEACIWKAWSSAGSTNRFFLTRWTTSATSAIPGRRRYLFCFVSGSKKLDKVIVKLRPHTLDCWSEADLLDQIHQTSLVLHSPSLPFLTSKEVWWIWSKRSASDQQSSVCGRSFTSRWPTFVVLVLNFEFCFFPPSEIKQGWVMN